MALKLDMSKVYDRLEWICLNKIMEKLGFEANWRELMMRCNIGYLLCENKWKAKRPH